MWNGARDHCRASQVTDASFRPLLAVILAALRSDARRQAAVVLKGLLTTLFKASVATKTAHPYLQQHSSLAWRQQWAKDGGDAARPQIGSSAARDAAAAIREGRQQR